MKTLLTVLFLFLLAGSTYACGGSCGGGSCGGSCGATSCGGGCSCGRCSASEQQGLPRSNIQNVAVQEVGNTICPIEGGKIGSMGQGVKVNYSGKSYNVCCQGCVMAFQSDPEKYSKIADDDVKKTQEVDDEKK